MKCEYPYVSRDKTPFGCGQCMVCRINQRRVWTARLCLEDQVNGPGLFVTLTYDDDHCPGTLRKDHVQKYFRALRKKGYTFRYFCVGEYGEQTGRPHYHLLLFRTCDERYHDWKSGFKEDISKLWKFGFTLIGDVSRFSAAYCAGYVTKKAQKESDPDRPEWILTSRSPALGVPAVPFIAESLMKYDFFNQHHNDVPTAVSVGGRILPLGRRIRHELRSYLEEHYGVICDKDEGIRNLRQETEAFFVRWEADEAAKGNKRYIYGFDRFSIALSERESRSRKSALASVGLDGRRSL